MLMALATMDNEIAHRSKRTAAFHLSQIALNPNIKDSLQHIIGCLVALVLHSGNSTRLDSAISTAFEFVSRRHGNKASDLFLRHIGDPKFNGHLEAKAQHIQNTLSRWKERTTKSIQDRGFTKKVWEEALRISQTCTLDMNDAQPTSIEEVTQWLDKDARPYNSEMEDAFTALTDNRNGIRSGLKNGTFYKFLQSNNADCVHLT